MNGRPRLHRPEPERTEPLRHWSTLYRTSESWNPRDTGGAGDGAADAASPPSDAWSDVVADGVAVGYRVIEEQIRQGQRVAEQISGASYGPAAMSGDVREASERLVRFSADLVALWMDFVNSTLANGDLLRGLAAAWTPPAAAAAPSPTSYGAATAVAIEVQSARPVRVSVEFKPGVGARPLATHALRALAADLPPLDDVAFVAERDGAAPVLRLRVPDGQPGGVYSGVVLDAQSGEPLGTITARLSA
ncbi:MAG: hypothetical protein SF182_22020 [Deltaproteobacteria bacterium]|nr:hypothetical protein [Deltaproteobacteria bacterium]